MAEQHRRAAVLGSPIAHSKSPALHRAAYAALGLDWTYEAIEMDAGDLPEFMTSLDASWAGLSLTMPLKEAVIGLLDEVDEMALRLQAVNTVVRAGAGWAGCNTDVFGIVQAARGSLLEDPRRVAIIGAGATARSAMAAAADLGAREVALIARRTHAAAELAELAEWLDLALEVRALDHTGADALAEADLVISTLPGGAQLPPPLLEVAGQGLLLDAAYEPWPSALAAGWSGTAVSGLEMLLWQACEQVRLMTGLPAPEQAMRAALSTA